MNKILSMIKRLFSIRKYNEFTIIDHFRKQGAQIGEDCRILIKGLGGEPWLIRIHNHVTIAPNVSLVTHDGGCWVFRKEHPDLNVFGKIEIFDNCFIGLGSIIMPNVEIGPNSIVAAGALVTKNVPPNSIVAGIPAKVMCTIDDYKKRCLEKWDKQKPPKFKLSEEKREMSQIEIAKIMQTEENFKVLRDHLVNYFWGK